MLCPCRALLPSAPLCSLHTALGAKGASESGVRADFLTATGQGNKWPRNCAEHGVCGEWGRLQEPLRQRAMGRASVTDQLLQGIVGARRGRHVSPQGFIAFGPCHTGETGRLPGTERGSALSLEPRRDRQNITSLTWRRVWGDGNSLEIQGPKSHWTLGFWTQSRGLS